LLIKNSKMATPSQKLAESLEALKELQSKDGSTVVHTGQLSRIHRERLLSSGFLQEVIKGWYIASFPEENSGESGSWYSTFWSFCARYLDYRFADEWVISPEQSLKLISGNFTVPDQLLIKSPKANNNKVSLPFNTSIFDVKSSLPRKNKMVSNNGLRLYSLPAALIACSERFFYQSPDDARTALLMIRDASQILSPLLDGGHTVVAGRLAGAFRNIEQPDVADEIIATMKAAGFDVREKDPFTEKLRYSLAPRPESPYVNRIIQMWQTMRQDIIKHLPNPPNKKIENNKYLEIVDETYKSDAYNSLSIEGYRVTSELIERVKSGEWNPEENKNDKNNVDAMAARGYWNAFQAVKQSIEKVLSGDKPGRIAREDHKIWYRELFAPSVTVGLIKPSDLAGYRNIPVYIKRSKHIPPNHEAVRELIPAFFELLENESVPFVRAVLGHYIFVYIHPYSDGNGRIARFLMNVMLASGGYPWIVIPITKRKEYMETLENASVDSDIENFSNFLAQLVEDGIKNH